VPVPLDVVGLVDRLWTGVGGPTAEPGRLVVHGPPHVVPSPFAVTAAATAAVSFAAVAMGDLAARRRGGGAVAVEVDSTHAVLACRSERVLRTDTPLAASDPLFGDHRGADGWIRIHTNYAHHRAAALAVLGVPEDRDRYVPAVRRWAVEELETAVVEAGGAAAAMRDATTWQRHPHGRLAGAGPIVGVEPGGDGPVDMLPPADRPLAGVRVLDLTRVIAGPAAARYLAAHGADVLRIEPPGFADVPLLAVDTGFGKRAAALDLTRGEDRRRFDDLVRGADVVVHGYRPGALAGLGYDEAALQALRPGLIDASLSAWGPAGPWARRRGFDSLVQMAGGIAEAGMRAAGVEHPVPLPMQLLDHGTAYLLAGGVARALARRSVEGGGWRVRTSLARTAAWLWDLGRHGDPSAPEPDVREVERHCDTMDTPWARTTFVRPPGRLIGFPAPTYRRPPPRPGADRAG
jgi:hypothetical protein